MVDLKDRRTVPCAHCNGKGTIELPPEIETVEVYYFGCWERPGHYWRRPNGCDARSIEEKIPKVLRRGHIDGCYCPGAAKGDQYQRSRPEVEGEAKLTWVKGDIELEIWTVLAWWDRSVDQRGACNSALVAKGSYDFTTMLEIGKAQFPSVLSRQRTPIVLIES